MTPTRDEIVFALALELPEAERAAFVLRECGGDAGLRARVEALLSSYDATANPLVTQLEPAGSPVPGLNFGEDDRVGQKLGRYKLLEKLGEGGCGVVYVAEQTEPVRRRVALKVIKLGMDTRQVVARFEAERQALALMDHPNIAKVLDAGTTEAGRPFFVMELVRGIRITDYCDQTNLSTQERLNLFIKVCQAIQHAHQKGIIHRDIKPSNILVTLHDGVPVPKVIDFGIAKATEGRLTDATVYTQLNQFIGTPAYMSPEQAEMSGLDIDTRSDIYSLGVLLYELLTGRTPFDAKELMSLGLDAMRKTIRERDPARPSTKLATLGGDELTTTAKRRATETAKLVSQLRGDLDWIVMKCLEKDRTRRYETANGLASDINRHLANEPVIACPPSAAYKLQKAFRRNKLIYVSGVVVFLALAAGVVLSAWQAVRADQEARKASTAEQLARQRLEESEAISKFMTEVFQSPDPAKDGRSITVAETLGAAAKKLERDLASLPERRAQLQAVLGKTYFSLGLYKEAVVLLEAASAHFISARGLDDSGTLHIQYDLALSYRFLGKRAEAVSLMKVVAERRGRILGNEHPDTLDARERLGFGLFQTGSVSNGLALLEATLSVSRQRLGADHPVTLMTMDDLMTVYAQDTDRRHEAVRLGEDVLALRRQLLGPEHPDTLTAMINLSDCFVAVERLEEALRLRERACDVCRRVLGPEHQNTLKALNRVGESYLWAGRPDEAVAIQEALLTVEQRVDGSEHPRTVGVMYSLTSSLAEVGRFSEALDVARRTLLLAGRIFAPTDINLVTALGNVSLCCIDVGQYEMALHYALRALETAQQTPMHGARGERQGIYGIEIEFARSHLGYPMQSAEAAKKALESLENLLGTDDGSVNWGREQVADILERAGLEGEAFATLKKAFASAGRTLEKNHPEYYFIANEFARSCFRSGHLDEAEALCRQPVTISEKNPSLERWESVRRGVLGMVLCAQKRDAVAEPELVACFETLRPRFHELKSFHRKFFLEPATALADLYERTGRPLKASAVRQEIEACNALAVTAREKAKFAL